MDNKSVIMLSNHFAAEPLDSCKRWSKKEKKFVEVQRPAVVREYNTNMGGIDLADRMISYCPMRARTKKWTVRTILHFADMAVSNAWLQYRIDLQERNVQEKLIKQLRAFKMCLGEKLIIEGQHRENDNISSEEDPQIQEPMKRRKQGFTPLPPEYKRKKSAIHLPEIQKLKVFQKCRLPGCKKLCRAKCVECKIFLCLNADRNCFMDFHK